MRLMTLKLKNFKGIRSFELQANGENVSLFGDNATGKTSIFDAFLWLLYGKDSQNKADFDIKTLDKDNKPLHGLEHEVEAVFEHNGKPLNLKKVFSEKWTKKRGSPTAEFSGHTTDYFVNSVPVKESEYKVKISEIANETIFKLLTSPIYFNTQLSWQERRKTLLQVCGDISDEDVIATKESLSKLPSILQGRSIEDHRKVIANRRAMINSELDKIPIRISEVQQSLPDISNLIPDALPTDIQKYAGMIQAKQQELISIKNGGEISEKIKQLRIVEGELLKIKNEFQSAINGQVQIKRNGINQLEDQAAVLRRESIPVDYSETVDQINGQIKILNNELEALRGEWRTLKVSEFEFEQSETCPLCGQALPEDQLQAAREKALADFNQQKSEKIEKNVETGKRKVEDITKLEAKIYELKQKESEANSLVEGKKAQLTELEKRISSIRENLTVLLNNSVEQTPKYHNKLREKEALDKEIKEAESGKEADIQPLQNTIDELIRDKAVLEKALNDVEYRKKGLARIEELKKQERDLAAEYERLEQELYLTEEFIRTKINLLEEKINNRFKLAKFKLFAEQVNGGLQEVCETLYDGVPYSSGLNYGHRILVGLDIIRTLSEHYGFSAPIFIDNQESVTRLPEMNAQIISLVVSKPDRKLRIEYPERILEEAS